MGLCKHINKNAIRTEFYKRPREEKNTTKKLMSRRMFCLKINVQIRVDINIKLYVFLIFSPQNIPYVSDKATSSVLIGVPFPGNLQLCSKRYTVLSGT